MTAKSHDRGHSIEFGEKNSKWFYSDNKKWLGDLIPCKNCGKKPVVLKVLIKNDNEKSVWKSKKIDVCIEPIVKE